MTDPTESLPGASLPPESVASPSVPAPSVPSAPVPSAPVPSRRREAFGALLVYLLLTYLFTSATWQDATNHWIGRCCDPEQSIWFLAWTPAALQLGQNPLLTDQLNAPHGANLMWNGGIPLLPR